MDKVDIGRRNFVKGAMMVPVGLYVAGCSAISSITTAAPQVAQDAVLIGQALSAVLPTIQTLTGLGSNVVNTISGVIDEIKSVASGLANATGTTATSLVQQLGGGIGTIAGLLSGVTSLPGIVNSVISDALGLLPVIEAAVGITAAPPAAARRFTAVTVGRTPDQMRADLALIAAGRR